MQFKQYIYESETTLQYHDNLNEKLWSNKVLHKKIKNHLLKIASAWQEFAKIPESAVLDIIITGGNANYNYTEFSDIDLHLFVDKNKIAACNKDVLNDYLLDKKALWALHHDIKVVGYPVELYAQDVNEPTSKNQGVYSLLKNKWIKPPVKEKVNFNDPLIKHKVASIKHHIDFFVNNKSNDVKKMQEYKEKIRKLRAASVQKGGEFSIENLVFKELRNKGYIEKFHDYIDHAQDHDLSLKK
jgi:hypothetical protein